MGIASVKMELLALGGFKFPVVAVYLNSLTSLTVLELQNAIDSLGGQRCIGSGAIESTYPTYSGAMQPFSFTTESGYAVEFTVRYVSFRQTNQLCIFDFYVRKENQDIIHSAHSYGYSGGNPWVEFSPAIMFISPSGKIAVPNFYGIVGYYDNLENNIACYLDGAYYVISINPNVPWVAGQNYGNGFIEIDVEHSDIPIASPSGTPYEGEPSGPGGAETGTHELIFDPIDFPDTPSISLSDGGFISIWTPQKVQLLNLAKFFWSKDILSGSWWKNLVSNPIDMIVGLQILPIPIDREGISHTTLNLGVVDTGVDMDYISEQFIEISCGSIELSEYWDAYIDYEPYTKISIYLPFIGVKELNTNDIMDTTVELKYVIDIASGACVAMIKADDSVMYHFAGNCAATVPLTSLQMQEVVKNVTQTAITVGVGIASIAATEGAAAPAVGSMISSGINTVTHGPSVARSGSIAGNSGFMSVQTPYLIISRPNLCMPEEQQKYTGFPAFIAENLDELTGYTEVDVVHLHVMGCTDDELAEIDELLKKGVIF